MNALLGVPDVKEMWHRGIKLVAVNAPDGLCGTGLLDCHFIADHGGKVCSKYCPGFDPLARIWIRESQMPEYLAARLLEGAT